MSVPVSLDFMFHENPSYSGPPKKGMRDFVIFTHRELHYWRSCQKIRKFKLIVDFPRTERFVKDIDLWIYFATKLANVEDFELECESGYEFPQFAYKNKSWRNLDLGFCTLNPLANVNWSGIVSLSFSYTYLTDDVMENILSGCPNLECLKFYHFFGFRRLEIRNVKSRKLVIENLNHDDERDVWLEIISPYIQNLKILGSCHEISL
uniref:Ubiquitin-protein ligase n=1 Tax=Solanum tuberosum TaxID=4113 RepID=M1DGJ8_SOLTU